uniref:UPF0489 protein C5orf22-like n=1 Tax=Styela clava TaxID=7725 RepID=UPI00193A0930|nr:UPF0489 protein C5orf22-like [Styela clava]
MSKKYKKLPVHIVEYHNDALEHIYRAIGSKYLPTNDITMLHFDAHPDMIIPDISADDVYDKKKLFDSLSIENWITPALFAGHISSLVWLKAEWARQISDGFYEFEIGKHFESLKIRATFPDDYFLSECLYSPKNELIDPKNVNFYVKTIKPDNSEYDKTDFCEILGKKTYILDIDLDFFSTKNPIKEMLSYENYSKLKKIYEFSPPSTRSEKDIKNCLENRQKLLNELKNMLLDIERGDNEKWTEKDTFSTLKYIYENVKKSDSGNEIDAALLHEFGCTCDDPELPHHVSTEAEINKLIKSVEICLKNIGRPPTLVTVSRSSIDEYCPPHQVDNIQSKVVECLRDLFGEIEVFYHYKD